MNTFTPVKEGWRYYRLVEKYWAADHRLMAVVDHYYDPDDDDPDEDLESLDVAYWITEGVYRERQRTAGFPSVGENGWQLIDACENGRSIHAYEDGGEIEPITFEEAMALSDPLWDLLLGGDEG